VRRTFYDLSRQIGLRGPEDRKGPRLHDFRHRFAVRTLVQWYQSNEDIERRLPVLSTFLGTGMWQIPTGTGGACYPPPGNQMGLTHEE